MLLGQTTRLAAVGLLGRKVHLESVVFGRIGSVEVQWDGWDSIDIS